MLRRANAPAGRARAAAERTRRQARRLQAAELFAQGVRPAQVARTLGVGPGAHRHGDRAADRGALPPRASVGGAAPAAGLERAASHPPRWRARRGRHHAWVAQDWPRIKAGTHRRNARVVFFDESGRACCQACAAPGRRWASRRCCATRSTGSAPRWPPHCATGPPAGAPCCASMSIRAATTPAA
jgi:hypothetical protein